MKYIRHLFMNYHYAMAKFYDRGFKYHCAKHSALFYKNNAQDI